MDNSPITLFLDIETGITFDISANEFEVSKDGGETWELVSPVDALNLLRNSRTPTTSSGVAKYNKILDALESLGHFIHF